MRIDAKHETQENPVQSLCKPREEPNIFELFRGPPKLLLVRAQVKNLVALCKLNPAVDGLWMTI